MFITNKTSCGIKFLFKNRPVDKVRISSATQFLPAHSDSEIFLDKEIRLLRNIRFIRCIFRRQNFSEITIDNCIFEECSFVACRFEDVEFHDCQIKNCLFNKCRFEKTYLDPNVLKYNFQEWKIDASNINTTLFQRLEANFRDLHQEDFAERAHIRFRRYRRWQDIYEAKRAIGIVRNARLRWNFTVDLIFDFFLLYGYGLYRALIFTFLALYLGTIGLDLYWEELKLTANVSDLALDKTNTLQKLYFLLVTASTLGYGDITPRSEFGMCFIVLLLILSIIWTATLTALIVKRLVK